LGNPSFHMESTWKWDGIHVEDSTWNPCGNSIWNGGIHMESTWFHVECRWKKITKMSEILAKRYSMWDGQIPCGTTWIPCGIRGHGKDLAGNMKLYISQPLFLASGCKKWSALNCKWLRPVKNNTVGLTIFFSWLVGLNATIDVISATCGIFWGYFWGSGRG